MIILVFFARKINECSKSYQ